MLISKASNWPLLSNGLHYNYLLNYYPTTCSFEANEKNGAIDGLFGILRILLGKLQHGITIGPWIMLFRKLNLS